MRILTAITLALVFLTACSNNKKQSSKTQAVKKEIRKEIDPMQDRGVGPIKKLTISHSIDQDLSNKGESLFNSKCTACHKIDKRKIGPPMLGVTKRRTPEWIMNMILNPDVMVKENEQARQLLMEYSAPMANQSLSEEEARSILEYFRTIDL